MLPGDTPARIMLLGTFHFHNPGLDEYKPQHQPDMLSEVKQRELEDVLDRLSLYRPTCVCVEVSRERQGDLDGEYAAYRAGEFRLDANEVYQLGFRLAARLGLERLHGVDAWGRLYESFATVEAQAKARGPAEEALLTHDDPWGRHYFDGYREGDARMAGAGLRELLLRANDGRDVLRAHGAYLTGMFELGGGEDYTGPDVIAGWWYCRNLRIFRNIQRVTSPGARMLVIIGSGHLAILRHCVEASPQHELVEVSAHLA